MSRFSKVLTEAINPLNRIANSIVKKLNYIEISLILDSTDFESDKKYLYKLAQYHSNSFNDLNDEQKEEVTEKVYNLVKHSLNTDKEKISENNDLETKIYQFLKNSGGILFPLETSAKKMAEFIRNKDAQ